LLNVFYDIKDIYPFIVIFVDCVTGGNCNAIGEDISIKQEISPGKTPFFELYLDGFMFLALL